MIHVDGRVVFSQRATYGVWQNQSRWPSGKTHHRTTKPVSARLSPNQPATSAQSTILPVSEAGFVSKFPKPTGRRLFSRAAIAQFCTKSPIGFVFSVEGRHAQICTNMHKSAQRPHSTIASQLPKIGLVPQKGPTDLRWGEVIGFVREL